MSGALTVLFIGPAGVGKSSLVKAYGDWLKSQGIGVARVNLDPAADYVPYEPDFDARKIVWAREIALKEGLGPNGALIRSIEILCSRVDEVLEAIASFDADFVLVDTPGQMELFVFRDLSLRIVDGLKKVSRGVVGVFVAEASMLRDPTDYAFLALICNAIQLRLDIDVVAVVNKVDAVDSVPEGVRTWIELLQEASKALETRGAFGEMMSRILEALTSYSKAMNVPLVSATKGMGLEELHRIVHEVACSCGDLT